MSLQHLKLNALTEGDLQRLVNDAVPESKTLEYKAALEYATDDQKRELLSDITALANGEGGDIIYGIKADKGVAVALVGLKNLVPDDAQGKIENLLRDFVQPRILGFEMRAILLANKTHVLILRAPRSFAAPHMVRHQGITRFCGRNSNGKYELDVQELRSAFVANETYADRLKSFRLNRVNKLLSGEAPIAMHGEHLLVLHILPVSGARLDMRLDNAELGRLKDKGTPKPMGCSGWGASFNFDGLLVSSEKNDRKCYSYIQILRNGFLEAVDSITLDPQPLTRNGEPARIIPSIAWEKNILDVFPRYLNALIELGAPLPFAVSLSLLNVKGFSMYVGPGYGHRTQPIDRDNLLTEEILIESLPARADAILRPLFDQIWNACGWYGSINYNEAGEWREHR